MVKKYLQPKLYGEYNQLLKYNVDNSWQNKWEAVDAETSPTWFSTEIRVDSVEGCTVKAISAISSWVEIADETTVQTDEIVTPYKIEGNYYYLRIPHFGTWEVVAEKDNLIDSEIVSVNRIKQYRVSLYELIPAEVWITINNVAIATFNTVSTSLRDFVVDINLVQAGSGDPSPTNVRPISGWTGAKVCQGGTELSVTTTGGSLDDNGNETSSSNYKRTGFIDISTYQSILTSVTSNRTSGWYERICLYDENQQFLSLAYKRTHNSPDTFNHVIQTNGATYVRMSVRAGSETSAPKIFGSGKLYPVSWQTEAEEVFFGELSDNHDGTWDLSYSPASYIETNAEGKPVRGGVVQSWSRNIGSRPYVYATANPSNTAVVNHSSVCSMFKNGSPVSGEDGTATVYRSSGNSRIAFKDTSIPEWNSWMNSEITTDQFRELINAYFADLYANGIKFQMAWRLSEPAHITLTADSVKTLLGTNNIWCDTGNINTLTYQEK